MNTIDKLSTRAPTFSTFAGASRYADRTTRDFGRLHDVAMAVENGAIVAFVVVAMGDLPKLRRALPACVFARV